MSKQVTEEMISAYVDDELTAAERAAVESAISADKELQRIHDGYMAARNAIQESAQVVDRIGLPTNFSSDVMSRIKASRSQPELDFIETEVPGSLADGSQEREGRVRRAVAKSTGQGIWTVRTWIEIIAATAAIVIIVLSWWGKSNRDPNSTDLARPNDSRPDANAGPDKNRPEPKNQIRMMNVDGQDGQKTNESSNNRTSDSSSDQSNVDAVSKEKASSRKFSIFIDADARPEIDRFWIVNDYEITAPPGTSPDGSVADQTTGPVNVLLIDAGKDDAVRFLQQIPKWDPDFQVFLHRKQGKASWLAPYDVSHADQTEGSFWTLEIVLIDR